MQGKPYAAGPMSAGGQPVPGVPGVAAANHPPGVSPSLTQHPTAPINPYPATGAPPLAGAGQQPGAMATYPATQGQPMGGGPPGIAPQTGNYAANTIRPAPPGTALPRPSFMPVPGPATLGPAQSGTGSPGGVAGVSMAPLTAVQPPAATGGPHPLPALPQVPLPQGFPNPFQIQQLIPAPPAQVQPGAPGTQTITGPQGYHPGLGYFGSPFSPGPNTGNGQPLPVPSTAFPHVPGAPKPAASAAPPPVAAAPQPGTPSEPAAAPASGTAASPGQQTGPFWLQLAWQLVRTPAVRAALGDRYQALVESEDRRRTLQIGATVLSGHGMQQAFRAVASGSLDQSRFTQLFANELRSALQAHGLL